MHNILKQFHSERFKKFLPILSFFPRDILNRKTEASYWVMSSGKSEQHGVFSILIVDKKKISRPKKCVVVLMK